MPPGIAATALIGCRAGREVVERLTGNQHQAVDPLGAGKLLGKQELAAAPIIEHERDPAQFEPLEELAEQSRYPKLAQISIRPHRRAMPTQRERRQHTSVSRHPR